MLGILFFVRTAIALAAFVYLVVLWAYVPFVNPEADMNITVLSVFFGTTIPSGWVRDLLLLARAALGMLVTLYIFIPGLRFFFEFRATMYNNTVAIVLAGVSVAAFFAALIAHQLFYI